MLQRKRPTLKRSSQPAYYALEHRKPNSTEVDRGVLSQADCVAHVDPSLRINTSVVYGRGSSGTVYQMCDRMANCDRWAAKIVLLYTSPQTSFEQTAAQFVREGETASMLGDIGVGARVLGYRVCEDAQTGRQIGIIVTERFDETLKSYSQKYRSKYREAEDYIHGQVLAIVNTLATQGYRHFDLHSENVMVQLDAAHNIKRIALVDAGGIKKCNPQPCDREKVVKYALDQYQYSVDKHIHHRKSSASSASSVSVAQTKRVSRASGLSGSRTHIPTQRVSSRSTQNLPKPKRNKRSSQKSKSGSQRSLSIGSK